MKKNIFIILSFLQSLYVLSQNDTAAFVPEYKPGIVYVIKTNIGTSHRGFIVMENKDNIIIESKNTHDSLRINKINIISSKIISAPKTYEDKTYEKNQHAANYLISSSAFLFEEGASTSNTHWFLINNIDYAITENFALTANTLLFYPFSVGIKCAFRLNDLNYIGANIFIAVDPISLLSDGASILGYGANAKFTHGTENNNLTASAGLLGLNSDLFGIGPTPPFVNLAYVSLSYCNRFSERLAFNGEGWYFPQTQETIAGLGLKFVNNEKICWSFGCYAFLQNNGSTIQFGNNAIPIPYIGYSRRFN